MNKELITIQLTLYPDDIEACRVVSESSDDLDLVSLCKHIVEQVDAINFGKTLADITLEEDRQFQARLDNIPHKEKS
jgi:hypothetical protein